MDAHAHSPALSKTAAAQAHALFYQNKFAEAVPLYQQLLHSVTNDFLIWGNLGIALRHLHHYAAAAACLKRADELMPHSSGILFHYGYCLTFLDRKAEALEAFARALRLAPEDVNVMIYYAFALRTFGRDEEALALYDKAWKKSPDILDTLWSRTDVYLRLGRWKEAWKDFEARWKLGKGHLYWKQAEREKLYKSKRWTGEDLAGKTLFVYEEQGFGDMMLFSRFLPLLHQRGARIIFRCDPALHRLFKDMPGITAFVTTDEPALTADYHVPLMSVPGLLGTEIATLPPPAPFHVPDAPPAEAAALLASGKDRFRVGIVWSGRDSFTGNAKRAVPFSRFLPLMEIPGVQFFSLQKGPREKELAESGLAGVVPALAPHLDNFADTAAVLKSLDLVIMTDSAVAHLAGSIGCPVWNMLPYCAYWVYLLDRADTPWYPSMRLFRQPEPADWDSVFAAVAAELAQAVAAKKAGQWPWPPR